MAALTPIERALATYRGDWERRELDTKGYARVNPEALADNTSPDYVFRYIDISSVDHGSIDWASVLNLRFGDSPSRARRVVRSGDLLIGTVRPLLGSHAFADWASEEPTICSTGFAIIRATGKLLPMFLKHLAFAEQVTRQMVAWQCGTNYPAITERDVRRLTVPVPSKKEQAAIANVLEAIDNAINRIKRVIACSTVLDHSLLNELLEKGLQGKPGAGRNKSAKWVMRCVYEVASVDSGLTLGKDVSGFKSVELPYLRVANVQDGHLNLSEIKTVRVRVDEVENYRLEAGDVLMTEGGDLDKLGRGTIWEGQIPDCLHQNHIFRVRTNRELLLPEFFAFVVESDIAKRYFNRVAKRTTNLASTNKTQVRAFEFPLPPTTDEQQEIVEIVQASKAHLAALVQKERALREHKKSLMHDLLTGTVRVDPKLFKEEEQA